MPRPWLFLYAIIRRLSLLGGGGGVQKKPESGCCFEITLATYGGWVRGEREWSLWDGLEYYCNSPDKQCHQGQQCEKDTICYIGKRSYKIWGNQIWGFMEEKKLRKTWRHLALAGNQWHFQSRTRIWGIEYPKIGETTIVCTIAT